MTTMIVTSGNAEIAVETFGSAGDPPILLIMGAMASMLWWPDGFCAQLAGRGRFVIRYDNRDTGLSTAWPPGKPGYGADDMAEDPIAILDALDIRVAHVVGMSMGGMIAQRIALQHSDRVSTLTGISTSPMGIRGLPSPTEEYSEHSKNAASVDWSDRAEVIESMLRECRALAGTAHPHDPTAMRVFIERDYDRACSYESSTNHFLLGGDDGGSKLSPRDIRVPVLVIHGTSDPLFPIEHGRAFRDAVPNARLLPIAGGGHELHQDDWTAMIDAIVAHTAMGS